MTPEERINAALDSVLKIAGSSMYNYTENSLDKMRAVIRKAMGDSYIKGSNDCANAIKAQK